MSERTDAASSTLYNLAAALIAANAGKRFYGSAVEIIQTKLSTNAISFEAASKLLYEATAAVNSDHFEKWQTWRRSDLTSSAFAQNQSPKTIVASNANEYYRRAKHRGWGFDEVEIEL
jgi:hypothetical protein